MGPQHDHLPLRRAQVRVLAAGEVGTLGTASAWLPLDLPARYLCALGAYLTLAPTVYPWYLLPVVAPGAIFGGPLVVALPALVSLSDLVIVNKALGGRWQVPHLAWWTEYVGIYGLLLWEFARRLHRRRIADSTREVRSPSS